MALGLTGGIATGKSTAASILERFGAHVIEADEISRKILEKDGKAYEEVVAAFGGEILTEEGRINRDKLGEIIFNDSRQRQKLEKITHPYIIKNLKKRLAARNYSRDTVAVVPLLYEAQLQHLFEEVWVISCSEEEQISRLKNRDRLDSSQACSRLSAQMNLKDKEAKADQVIKNEGSLKELEDKLKKAWENWMDKNKFD